MRSRAMAATLQPRLLASRGLPVEMNAHFHRAMLIFHKTHLEHRYPFFVNWLVSLGIGLRWVAKSALLAVRRRPAG